LDSWWRAVIQRTLRIEQLTQALAEGAHGKVRSFLIQPECLLKQRLFTTGIAGPALCFPALTQTSPQDRWKLRRRVVADKRVSEVEEDCSDWHGLPQAG